MTRTAPGKACREGMTIVQLMDLFPSEDTAREWFESVIWPNDRHCPKCGSVRTHEVPSAKPMPYRCSDCRSYFSVKTGTVMQASKVPLRKWAIALYLCLTSHNSVSSMKLQRDLGVSQPTAWFMLHRIREAWGEDDREPFDGPAEADETDFGGTRKNMGNAKQKALAGTGRGAVGKTAVIGIKGRASNQVPAEVIAEADADTLQEFVEEDAMVFTDDARACKGMDRAHESVRHSVSEYVRGQAHTNGIESFRAMIKHAHDSTCHKIGPKHLHRPVSGFAGKHNVRDSGTLAQLRDTVARFVARLVGSRLFWPDLVADNGLSNAARA